MDQAEIKRLRGIAEASGAQRVATSSVSKPKNKSPGFTAWLSELSGTGGALAGAAAGTALLPGIGTVLGGLAGGFLGGTGGKLAENKGRDNEFRVSEALGEGAMSGLLGAGPIKLAKVATGAGNALLKGGGKLAVKEGAESALAKKLFTKTATEGSEGLLSKVGSGLRKDVVLPKVTAGVGGAQKEEAISKVASKVPGLSSKGKYKNLQPEMEKLTKQITPLLTASKKTVGSDDLLTTIRKNAEESSHFLAGDAAYEKQLASVLSDLSTKTGGSKKLNATQIFDYKKGMDMNSVFTKLEKGADLNPKEAARLAVWSSLDDGITKAAPAVKELTKQQSLLMQSAPGLKKGAEKTVGVPLLGIKSQKLAQAGQAVKELTGRVMQRGSGVTGGAVESLVKTPSALGILSRVGAGSKINSALNPIPVTEAPVNENIDPTTGLPVTDTAQLEEAGMSQDILSQPEQLKQGLQAAAMKALAAGDTKGLDSIVKTAGLLESLGAIPSAEEAKPLKKTEGQRARDGAARLTEKAMSQLEAGSINTGLVSGNFEKVKSIFGKADPETLEFNTTVSNLLAVIAKANAGTSFTAGEKALLQQYAPKVGDSGQVLRTKLAALKDVFSQAQEAEYGTEYQPDVTVGAI